MSCMEGFQIAACLRGEAVSEVIVGLLHPGQDDLRMHQEPSTTAGKLRMQNRADLAGVVEGSCLLERAGSTFGISCKGSVGSTGLCCRRSLRPFTFLWRIHHSRRGTTPVEGAGPIEGGWEAQFILQEGQNVIGRYRQSGAHGLPRDRPLFGDRKADHACFCREMLLQRDGPKYISPHAIGLAATGQMEVRVA